MAKKNHVGSRTISQIAIVVKNIDKSRKAFASVFGMDVPPVIVTAPAEQSHIRYRGKPTQARAKLAFFRFDNITLELIEPIGKPSTWKEALDANGESVHHIAFNIPDMDQTIASLKKKGLPLAQRGDYTGGCYAYIDSAKKLGVVLELLARTK
jgi:catechol 2,3-dioxygenase-like lactoylglutathione lyase family enzyme